MAHYAKIDNQNLVELVIVIPNHQEPTEEAGIEYCRRLFGGGEWRKTSYNATIRKNYAGKGFTYDQLRDAFIPPRPFPSWTLNEQTCRWEPPVSYPSDGQRYVWDEFTSNWVRVLA